MAVGINHGVTGASATTAWRGRISPYVLLFVGRGIPAGARVIQRLRMRAPVRKTQFQTVDGKDQH